MPLSCVAEAEALVACLQNKSNFRCRPVQRKNEGRRFGQPPELPLTDDDAYDKTAEYLLRRAIRKIIKRDIVPEVCEKLSKVNVRFDKRKPMLSGRERTNFADVHMNYASHKQYETDYLSEWKQRRVQEKCDKLMRDPKLLLNAARPPRR